MRKRKRDWPMTVLKYRAYPQAVPESVWRIAKTQRQLWNDLVSLWKAAADMAANLPDQKKEWWKEFEAWASAAVKMSGLDWVNGPEVLDRLRTCTRNRKIPRFHGALQRILLAHRYTAGGQPLANVIDPARTLKRFALNSAKEWVALNRQHIGLHSPKSKHWRGHFAAGEERIDFSLALHRALPPSAILKKVGWVGERSGRTWFWYIALTLEQPPEEGSRVHSGETGGISAGIDLGWRLFADATKHDYVRTAMVHDSEGRTIEIRLPLRLRPNRVQEQRGLDTLATLQAAATKIEKGSDEHHRVWQQIRVLRFRLIQRRRWYYLNLANYLCRRYGKIALEDMAINTLHRTPDHPGLQNAAQYRNYAAVGELRAMLVRTAPKYGTELVAVESIDSTRTCWECGAKAEAGANLVLKCANGHEWDQDKNAARNLLAQIEETFGQAHARKKPAAKWKPLEMPETIQAIAVEVPA